MDLPRFLSILLSLCLHTLIAVVAFFASKSVAPMIDLDRVVEVGVYTIGSQGSRAVAPKVPSAPRTVEAPPKPQETQPKPPEVKAPQTPQTPPKQPDPVTPPPDVKPIADTAPKDPPRPVNATKPVAERPTNATKPATPAVDPIKSALTDFGKNQPKTPPGDSRGGGKPNPNSIANALGDFKKSGSGGDGDSGTGPGGSGGDGIGLLGTYQQSLVSRIRPYWEYQGRADRRNPKAIAKIFIAKDGTIMDAKIEQSSGDAAFDGSVLKAIRDTIKVEAPPTPALMEISLPFMYEGLMAR